MLPQARRRGTRLPRDDRASGACYHECMDRPRKIISCEVLRNEVECVNPGYEVDFFEGALHDYPDRMRAAIQQRIDDTEGEREILLCCGRCSNGAAGLDAGPHRLVLPAVDDCISLVLGSREDYLTEHRAQPGTYYYTRGWIDFIQDPYKEYLKIVPKFGEEKAAMVARMIMEHYTRVAVIETPGVPGVADKRAYLDEVCAFYDLPLEPLTGSLRFFEKLMGGPYDDEFIVVEPGDSLEERRFWGLPGA
jgi:hypothetical protein